MLYKKIIAGIVEQVFNDQGECLRQEFIPATYSWWEHETVWFEEEGGYTINATDMPFGGNEHFSLDMVQPCQ